MTRIIVGCGEYGAAENISNYESDSKIGKRD